MTPIEKNVIVVDEQGNEYEANYPTRATGLVKHGRARFIDDNKICLTCPPNLYLEDKMKDENKDVKTNETEEKVMDAATETAEGQIAEADIQPSDPTGEKMTPEAIFAKLTELQEMIAGAIAFDSPVDDETIQGMVRLYEKMYDDVRPKTLPGKILLDELKSMTKDPRFDADMRELAKVRINEVIMDMMDMYHKEFAVKVSSENKAEFDPKAETIKRMNAILDDPNASEQMKSDAITTLGMIMVNH